VENLGIDQHQTLTKNLYMHSSITIGMPDSTSFISTIMQIAGALYAIFIAVIILGIQHGFTVLNADSTNKEKRNELAKTIQEFQIAHQMLAYFFLFLEFSCGAYLFYVSGHTFTLLVLYVIFMLAIVYFIFISYHLIGYLISIAVEDKNNKPNFGVFNCVYKLEFTHGIMALLCVFLIICLLPIVRNLIYSNEIFMEDASDTIKKIISVIISTVCGLISFMTYYILIRKHENKNRKEYKQEVANYKKEGTKIHQLKNGK